MSVRRLTKEGRGRLTRQAVDLAVVEVHEHVVQSLHRVCVRVRVAPPPLEELAAHQAAVHVHVRQRNTADLRGRVVAAMHRGVFRYRIEAKSARLAPTFSKSKSRYARLIVSR